MTQAKKYKKTPINRYGFPLKVRITAPKRGPRKQTLMKIEIFEEFCRWASLPTPLREPKGQTEFATKWGVSPPTLLKWKKKQEFWEKMANYRREWARDKTSDVINGLFKNAVNRGSAAEVKLWLQVVEDWAERTSPVPQSITVIGIQGITDADLKKLITPQQEEISEAEIVST
jgi:hypothetical protein